MSAVMTTQTAPQPADFAAVRATNLAVVLRHVRDAAPCSRADIAAATGLNKATVSSLVVELIERRLVRETGMTENRVGRPATMIVLDGGSYAAVGLEVGADHLTAVALDLAGGEVVSWRRAFTPSPRSVAAIATLAGRVITKVTGTGRTVLGVTVGVPGLVSADGTVRAPVLGWYDVDLAGQLRRALKREVSVEPSATLAARAEQRLGPCAGLENFTVVIADAGITAGLVVDGRPLHGAHGLTGQLGHIVLDPAGPPCACGLTGCLEAYAGIPALIARALPDALEDGPVVDFAPEMTRLLTRARLGDRATLDVLGDVGRRLGQGIAVLANLVNPEVVVLGGLYEPLAPWLLPLAQAELRLRSAAPDAGGCRIVASALGPVAAATGGAVQSLAAVEAGTLPAV